MSGTRESELYRIHNDALHRNAYALLAAAGACIAAGIAHTTGESFTAVHLIWILAVAAWGISAVSGLRHLMFIRSIMYDAATQLAVQEGKVPSVGHDPMLIQMMVNDLFQKMEKKSDLAQSYSSVQFWMLLIGGWLYLIYHVFEMIILAGTSAHAAPV